MASTNKQKSLNKDGRKDGRAAGEMRPLRIETDVLRYAEGSCMVHLGDTQVLCAASVDESVPSFLRNSGEGWVTAEYAMLPRATQSRSDRRKQLDASRNREIQRLIGRSLRSVCDRSLFTEKQVRIDCDVIQADGGTRSASIIGAYTALAIAFTRLQKYNIIKTFPLRQPIAALSCGIVDGALLCDLCYEEDSGAFADANFVLAEGGGIVEVQATGEAAPFTQDQLTALLALAQANMGHIFAAQKQAIEAVVS